MRDIVDIVGNIIFISACTTQTDLQPYENIGLESWEPPGDSSSFCRCSLKIFLGMKVLEHSLQYSLYVLRKARGLVNVNSPQVKTEMGWIPPLRWL